MLGHQVAAGIAPFTPSDDQESAIYIIKNILSANHYRSVPLDDSLSEKIFDRYLELLDNSKVFFYQEDIDRIAPYRNLIDDFIENVDLEKLYAIYADYQQRVLERYEYALKLLAQDHDFSLIEDFAPNRDDANWEKNSKAMDEVWRKRVKRDLLDLIVSGSSEEEGKEMLSKRYKNIIQRVKLQTASDAFRIIANAFTTSFDPHTEYFTPHGSANFNIMMRLSLEGIGAVLRIENEFVSIVEIIPGSPAAGSGMLRPGDKIIGVGQADGEIEDVIGRRLDDVVDLIRGPKGSLVRLRILAKDKVGISNSVIVRIKRDKIKLEDEAANKSIIEIPHEPKPLRIGIIELPSFYRDFAAYLERKEGFRSSTKDAKKLLASLEDEKVDGIIIDLRNNSGGSLDEAAEFTGLFIDSGPVVQIKNTRGWVSHKEDVDDAIDYRGPIAVLVNRYSASASEIFAAAIQDYRRGLIIGERTYGKGTVQKLVDLNEISPVPIKKDLGRLKVTTSEFYRINGESTQRNGVIPDITLPSPIPANDFGERSLPNSLLPSTIRPVSFKTQKNQITNDEIRHVKELYKQRLQSDPTLTLAQKYFDYLQSQRQRKSVSLQLDSQRATHAENKVRTEKLSESLRHAIADSTISSQTESSDATSLQLERFMLIEASLVLADHIKLHNRGEPIGANR